MSPDDPVSIRTFSRIVWTDPPTLDDVTPKPPRGRLARPELERLSSGISVFRTASLARRTARSRPPWLGQGCIARIELPVKGEFVIERTTASRGHDTLWGDPHDILSWIVAVEPVSPTGGEE